MGAPKIEAAIGPVNGSNRVFTTSVDYRPNSVEVWRNGVLLEQGMTDGWVALGSKKVRLNQPPKTGDTVSIYYIAI